MCRPHWLHCGNWIDKTAFSWWFGICVWTWGREYQPRFYLKSLIGKSRFLKERASIVNWKDIEVFRNLFRRWNPLSKLISENRQTKKESILVLWSRKAIDRWLLIVSGMRFEEKFQKNADLSIKYMQREIQAKHQEIEVKII